MVQFRLRTLLLLVIPIAISVLLLFRPAPINVTLVVLGWSFGLSITLRRDAFVFRSTPGFWLPALVLSAGFLSFGFSFLYALAHSMDPIGPKADWFPYSLFGGLAGMAVGLLGLLVQRR